MLRTAMLLGSILALIVAPAHGQLDPRAAPPAGVCAITMTRGLVAREQAGQMVLEHVYEEHIRCTPSDPVHDRLEMLRQVSGYVDESYGRFWDRALDVSDGRIFAFAMEVAEDRERHVTHRMGALRQMYATVFPGVRPLLFRQFVGAADDPARPCAVVVSDQPPPSFGKVPLPLDAHARLRALADSLWADPSESSELRAAAACIRQRSEVAGLQW